MALGLMFHLMQMHSFLKFGYIVQVLFCGCCMYTSPNYVNICHGRAKQLPSGKNLNLLKCQQSVPGALHGKRKSTDLQLSLCPQVVVADWEMHEWRRMGRVLQSQQHVKSSPCLAGVQTYNAHSASNSAQGLPPILCGLLECLKMSNNQGA